jgi:hypothetical protein
MGSVARPSIRIGGGMLDVVIAQGEVLNSASIAEWAKFGLLGLVLLWIFFFHLPAKDAQTRELLSLFANERENDRKARHEQSAEFTKNLNGVIDSHRTALAVVCAEFRVDMKAEREACEKLVRQAAESIRGK